MTEVVDRASAQPGEEMTTGNAAHNEIQYIDIQHESVVEKHLRNLN